MNARGRVPKTEWSPAGAERTVKLATTGARRVERELGGSYSPPWRNTDLPVLTARTQRPWSPDKTSSASAVDHSS